MPTTISNADISVQSEQVDLVSATTAVLWMTALVIGVVGRLSAPPSLAPASATVVAPLAVELMDALPPDQAPPKLVQPTESPPQPPAAPQVPALPVVLRVAAPQEMVEPLPAPPPPPPTTAPLSTAQRLPAPSLPGNTAGAARASAAGNGSTASTVPQLITYGQGEGYQPKPIYPPDAAADEQQGVVVVRFTVDQFGRVTDAYAVVPSPWPLLNNAAVQAVRDTWRFAPGKPRLLQVSLQFKLQPR